MALLEDLLLCFRQALTLSPEQLEVRTINLADQPVQLRVLGKSLFQKLWPAWRHLESQAKSVTSQLDVLDLSLAPYPPYAPVDKPEFQLDENQAMQKLPGSISVLCRKTSRLMLAVTNSAELSVYETGRPCHAVLSIWHLDQDRPLIHAGMVEWQGRGILIGGPSGSGKSHTCLQLAAAGGAYLGDDMVALKSNENGYAATSLYGSTFLNPKDLARFPWLSQRRSEPGQKSLSFLQTKMGTYSRVSLILLPTAEETDTPAILEPAKHLEAFIALAPSSLQTGSLSPGEKGFRLLASLCREIPAYHLKSGTGFIERLEKTLP